MLEVGRHTVVFDTAIISNLILMVIAVAINVVILHLHIVVTTNQFLLLIKEFIFVESIYLKI